LRECAVDVVVVVKPELRFGKVIRRQIVCHVIKARDSCAVLGPHGFVRRSRSGFMRTPRSDRSSTAALWAQRVFGIFFAFDILSIYVSELQVRKTITPTTYLEERTNPYS
jgi:hypothetical protein